MAKTVLHKKTAAQKKKIVYKKNAVQKKKVVHKNDKVVIAVAYEIYVHLYVYGNMYIHTCVDKAKNEVEEEQQEEEEEAL